MPQPSATPDDPNTLITQATTKYVERLTPWLLEVGSWIFGGLIAFDLILLGPLLTIGSVDTAIIVSTAAFALVLPLDVTGLFLLRLVRDLGHVGIELDFENDVRRAMESAIPTSETPVPAPKTLEAVQKRKTRTTLLYSVNILALCALLTLTGITAALWHVARWIAIAFALMVLICLVIVNVAVLTSRIPESPEEKAQRRRTGDAFARQAREQYQRNAHWK